MIFSHPSQVLRSIKALAHVLVPHPRQRASGPGRALQATIATNQSLHHLLQIHLESRKQLGIKRFHLGPPFPTSGILDELPIFSTLQFPSL